MEICFIILRKLSENMISLIFGKRIVRRLKTVGYNVYIMRQTACLVDNLIIVDSSLSVCTAEVQVPGSNLNENL